MKMDIVVVDGRQYLARGWLNRVSAPVGTLLGPNAIGEHMVVIEDDVPMDRVRVAHARPDDFTRLPGQPRSVLEHNLIVQNRFGGRREAPSRTSDVRSQLLRGVRGRSHRG